MSRRNSDASAGSTEYDEFDVTAAFSDDDAGSAPANAAEPAATVTATPAAANDAGSRVSTDSVPPAAPPRFKVTKEEKRALSAIYSALTDAAFLEGEIATLQQLINRASAANQHRRVKTAENKLKEARARLAVLTSTADTEILSLSDPSAELKVVSNAHPATIALAVVSATTGGTALGLSAYVVLNAMINAQASASAAFAAIPQASFAIAIYVLAAAAVVTGIAAISVAGAGLRGAPYLAKRMKKLSDSTKPADPQQQGDVREWDM